VAGVKNPSLPARNYPEYAAGGFSHMDGTIEFFTRVRALLPSEGRILDFGAGRGELAVDGHGYRSRLVDLRGSGRTIIGLDVDDAVLTNPTLDQRLVYDGKAIPLDSGSIDLIVSDHTFEHVTDPDLTTGELDRVLKPGGWLCARTPYLYSALVLASSLVPNRRHAFLLDHVQKGRHSRDVFPTTYGMNSRSAIKKYFPDYTDASYTYSPEPAYHFGSMLIFKAMQVYQYVKRPLLGGEVLMIFVQKPEYAERSGLACR